MCPSHERQGKIIVADLPDESIEVGEAVTVSMRESLGYQAVVIAYGVPAVLMPGGLFFFHFLGINDGLSAVLTLIVTGGYFGLIWLFRGRLRRKFVFKVQKHIDYQY